jgi:hypothetical protein
MNMHDFRLLLEGQEIQLFMDLFILEDGNGKLS